MLAVTELFRLISLIHCLFDDDYTVRGILKNNCRQLFARQIGPSIYSLFNLFVVEKKVTWCVKHGKFAQITVHSVTNLSVEVAK